MSVIRAGSSLFPTMPCMVGRRFSTPKDSWVTGYISCPRPWESVVQLEILPTPILSPWKTSLLSEAHTWVTSLEKNPQIYFSSFWVQAFGLSLEKKLVYCELGCQFTALQLQCANFPCAYSRYASKQFFAVWPPFHGAPCRASLYKVLKWVDRNLAHIYTINTDPNSWCTKPYNILELVWTRWTGWY